MIPNLIMFVPLSLVLTHFTSNVKLQCDSNKQVSHLINIDYRIIFIQLIIKLLYLIHGVAVLYSYLRVTFIFHVL